MNSVRAALCFLVAAACLCAGCAERPAQQTPEAPIGEWRQFRGPAGQGITAEENLPERWMGTSENVSWASPVPGSGNSSPIISGGRVFVTTVYNQPNDGPGVANRAKQIKRVVLAYDIKSGEKLWETVVFEGRRGKAHFSSTRAAPTPVTDGRYVFVSFDGHLSALDFDGQVVWDQDVDPGYYDYSHYGVSSSPVLAGDAVILLQDKEEGETSDPGWIAAFDRRTGERLWRDEWMHTCCSYNTPIVVERGGRLEVWNATALEVIGYDAQTGEKLWRGEHPTMQTVPSMVRQGTLFCSPGGIHTNKIVMFHLCEEGSGVNPIQIWSSGQGVPEISSPVLYRDKLFTVTTGGALYVREPLTGEIIWRRRLAPGEYRSSLVAGDGKVYVLNNRGVTTVIDADSDPPRFIARNNLPSGSTASPAIADGAIFVRSRTRLYRIDKESTDPSQVAPDSAAQVDTAEAEL